MHEMVLELAALLLSLFCLIYSMTVRRELYTRKTGGLLQILKNQHTLYLCLLGAVIADAGSSIAGTIAQGLGAGTLVIFSLRVVNSLFHCLPAFFFSLYVMALASPAKQRQSWFSGLFILPLLAGELLALTTPWTRLCYTMDGGVVSNGPGIWALYAVTAFYIVAGALYFLRFGRALPKADRMAAMILMFVAVAGVAVQTIWSVPVELFFEAIALFGFMALLEHDEDASQTGMSSRFMRSAMIALTLTFLAVIVMNVSLILNLNNTQSEKIGNIRLDVIRSDLQDTISEAETNVLRVAMGAEQLLDANASQETIAQYFDELKEGFLADESFMNVYIAGRDWHIIPGFDAPPEFHANERVWYLGAEENPGTVFITEPYIDANTGAMCFTVSTMLSDGNTVVALDLNFSKAQESILRMTEGTDQTAMIVTSGGLITGYTDMSLVGERADEKLPEYAEVLRRVTTSQEHDSFRVTLNGRDCIIFSSETSNNWYLILSVDTGTLYAESYRQMAMMLAVNLLMLVVMVLFFLVGNRNRRQTTKALAESERFLDGLAGKLRHEAKQIHLLHDSVRETGEPAGILSQIQEAGGQLNKLADNIQSYAKLLLAQKEQEEKRQAGRRAASAEAPSAKARNGIILILLFAMCIVLFLCYRSAADRGDIRMNREADSYENQLNEWITEQQSLLFSMTDLISSNPELMEDYEKAVHLLNDFAAHYPDISACYMANPYAEHPVIMNTGWEPGEDYLPETRPWYRAAERSSSHFSISAPYMDVQTGTYCITLSRVVYGEQGEFLGVFGIDFFLDKLTRVLGESYTETSYAFLVDSDGVIISHPNEAYQMNDHSSVSVEDTEYADAYHQENIAVLRDYTGHFAACLSRKTDSGFTVLVVNQWESIYGGVVLVTLAILALFGFCIGFIVLLINRLIRWQEMVNRQLVEAADAATKAGQAKSQFLSQMSHEIRTPMNAIIGLDTIALRDPDISSRTREQLEKINSSAHHLLSLINDILDMSRIESGRMTLNEKEFSFREFLDQINVIINGQCMDKGLRYESRTAGSTDEFFIGDDLKLKQVIINILGNSVKFTDAPGKVTFTAEETGVDGEHCVLRFTMQDTGVGMDKAFIPKLFEAFSQEDTAKTNRYGGSGLGMAITKSIVEMMGGQIQVESEKGVGSTFTVSVSLKRSQKKSAPAETEEQAPETAAHGKWHVLIAEDNEINAEILMDLLDMEGITSEWAENGKLAVERFEQSEENHFDVVLMDMRMPVMDGLTATRELRKLERPDAQRAPIIALTANAFEDDVRQCLQAGMNAHLSKPIDIALLIETVSRLLAERAD